MPEQMLNFTHIREKEIVKGITPFSIINIHILKSKIRIQDWGWGHWLTPVIPAFWEAKVGGSPKVKSSRPAWLTWQKPVSTNKYQN